MRLYHGSIKVVELPVILANQRLLDFGNGFYTTKPTIVRLKTHKLFDQFSFHNSQVLQEIKFVESYQVI